VLKSGDDCNTANAALHYTALALTRDNTNVAVFLVEKGLRIDHPSYFKDTAIHIASETGNVMMVKFSLRLGANPILCDGNMKRPLIIASDEGHLEVVRCLLRDERVRDRIDSRDAASQTATYKATYYGYVHVLRELLRAGADPFVDDINRHHVMTVVAISRHHPECLSVIEVRDR